MDTERVLAARAVIDAFYELPGNENTGGNLHIVVDDGGVEDGNVEFCFEQAKREGDVFGMFVARMLLALPLDERRLATTFYNDPELVALTAK